MEVDGDAVGEQLRMFQDQYEEKSREYDRLYKEFNEASQVGRFIQTEPLFRHLGSIRYDTVCIKEISCVVCYSGAADQADGHRGFQ